jgi:outer membrane protein assembly factor BamB
MKTSFRNNCILPVTLLLLALNFYNHCVEASNWPQWRGPNANGLVDEGNPPVNWSETNNVKWKTPIPGQGHATPIIWEDKIFILTVVEQKSTATQSPAEENTQSRSQNQTRQRGENRGEGGRGGFNFEEIRARFDTNKDGQLDDNERAAMRAQFGNRGRSGGRRRGRGGFGGSAPATKHTFTILCLNRSTGSVLWERIAHEEVPHQGVQRSNTYGSASPVTDGEHVYVSFGSYGLYCYDMEGELVWDKQLGKVSVTFGEGTSPVLHDHTLVVVQDNNDESFIYGFEKDTGKQLWKKPRDEGSGWTTPYIMERDGKTQVLVSGSKAIRSYDIKTGEMIWQCSGLGSNPVPMIVADADAIYAMSGHRQPFGMAIRMGKTGDLSGTDSVLWTTNRGTPYVPSPLLYEGLLFYCQRSDGIFTCVDAATGKAYYNQERIEGVDGVYASPVGVQDRIYLPGQNGNTAVIKKSEQFQVLSVNKLDDQFDASPVVVGNELYLRGKRSLYCLAR